MSKNENINSKHPLSSFNYTLAVLFYMELGKRCRWGTRNLLAVKTIFALLTAVSCSRYDKNSQVRTRECKKGCRILPSRPVPISCPSLCLDQIRAPWQPQSVFDRVSPRPAVDTWVDTNHIMINAKASTEGCLFSLTSHMSIWNHSPKMSYFHVL